MMLFMHDKGYNFFTINNLTLNEMNVLIEGYNSIEKEKERAHKRAMAKSKKMPRLRRK